MRLIDKINRVLFADELYWYNAEVLGDMTLTQSQRAEEASKMKPEQWDMLTFLSALKPYELLRIAGLAGYQMPNETAKEREKMDGIMWDWAKEIVHSRGFHLYHLYGSKSARIQAALQELAQYKYVHAVAHMMKMGYIIDIPESCKPEWDRLCEKRIKKSLAEDERRHKAVEGEI